MKRNKKVYIILAIFIIFITAVSVRRVMQNDIFFTIATGREMLANGYDNMDHLTWHEGLTFYKLRWAFDMIMTLLYNSTGFTGIYIFVMIIAVITMLSLFYILIKQKNNVVLAFIATVCSSLIMAGIGTFTARAQIISYLLLLLEVFFIERLLTTNKKRYYIYLFLISVFIVNFHASVWPVTIILVMPFLAEAILNKIIKKKKDIKLVIEDLKIKPLVITLILLLIGSFLSPIGTYTHIYMFKVMGSISSEFILELQPTNLLTSVGMCSMLVVYVIIALATKAKIKVRDLLLFFGLFIMAILAVRNQSFFFIIGMIPLTRLVNNFFETYDNEKLLEKLVSKLNKNSVITLLGVFILIFMLPNIVQRTKEEYVDKTAYPVDATEYILNNLDYQNMRIYDHFNFGSYLEFKGIKTFIDSRCEVYCREFNNVDILEDWYHVVNGEMHYDDLFDKYDIDYAIVYNTERINTYLNKDENYNKLYKDDYFSIYERK